jgi:hypothetical protein
MENEMIKLWMPLQKSHSGDFVGILSDNSIDRDGEFMSKKLLQKWVDNKTPLPMLANHENKLEKLIGGWHEKELVTKNGHTAMMAKPFFLVSNPLAVQAKSMVEEALAKGLGIGISIGAIPKGDMIEKEVDGKKYKGYTEAEILEATIVPIQSNRNASFSAVAKSFDIDVKGGPGSGPRRGSGNSKNDINGMEDIPKDEYNDVQQRLTSSEQNEYISSRRNGLSHSAAMRELGKSFDINLTNNTEGIVKMEEEKGKPVDEVLAEAEAPKEEVKEEAPVEEAKEEEAPKEEEAKVEEAPAEEEKSIADELKIVKAELDALKKKAVLKATVEGPTEVKKEVEPTFVNLMKQKYGGNV